MKQQSKNQKLVIYVTKHVSILTDLYIKFIITQKQEMPTSANEKNLK